MSLQPSSPDPTSPSFRQSITKIEDLTSRISESLAAAQNQLNSRPSSTALPDSTIDEVEEEKTEHLSPKSLPSSRPSSARPLTSSSTRWAYSGNRRSMIMEDSKASDTFQLADQTILQLQSDLAALNNKLIQESTLRQQLEHEKLCIELQLEDLSQSLFEEANKMVADVRQEMMDMKENEKQMESKLKAKDRDVERMARERDVWKRRWEEELEARRMEKGMIVAKEQELMRLAQNTPDPTLLHSPTPEVDGGRNRSMSTLSVGPFTSIAQIQFQTDNAAYVEFLDFLSYGPDAVTGIWSVTRSVNASFSAPSPPLSPTHIAPSASTPSSLSVDVNWNAVWSTRFARRIQYEDVDPCLKFPAIGWKMSRKLPSACRAGTVLLDIIPIVPETIKSVEAEPAVDIRTGELSSVQTESLASPTVTKALKRRSFFFSGGSDEVTLNLEGNEDPAQSSPCVLCGNLARRYRDGPAYALKFDGEAVLPDSPLVMVCVECRERLVVVCELWTYLRMVKLGLVKKPQEVIWVEVQRKRLDIWTCRNGVRWVTERETLSTQHIEDSRPGWLSVTLSSSE